MIDADRILSSKLTEQDIPELQTMIAEKNYVNNSRYDAVVALGKIGKAATSALIQLLQHDAPGIREAAARALGSIGTEAVAALPALIQMAQTDETDIRRTAIVSLGKLGAPALPVLSQTLAEKNPEIVGTVVTALLWVGPEAVPTLVQACSIPDDFIKEYAVQVLGQFGSAAQGAIPALTALLRSHSFRVREAAVMTLSKIGPEALPALLETLQDRDEEIRLLALDALASFGRQAQPAVAPLLDLLKTSVFFRMKDEIIATLSQISPETLLEEGFVPSFRAKGQEN